MKKNYILCLLCFLIIMLFYNNNIKTEEIDKTYNMLIEKETNIEKLQLDILEKENKILVLTEETKQVKESNEKLLYLGKFEITYYCPCKKCCGKINGITASGAKASEGITIAADTNKIPLNSFVYINGLGCRIVQDRGGCIKGNKLDVFVSSHEKALQLGRQKNVDVWIVK